MSGHTPGPWSTEHDGALVMGGEVVGYAPAPGAASRAEVKANAALIAAAPDLLAACEGLLVRHRCLGCGPLGGRHGSGCASAIAEAAIARARGGR